MLHSLDIHVDRRANIPITKQITEQLTHCIRDGRLAKGQMLPSIRQLAEFLGINRNTVVAVYRALEHAGYITTSPGTGSFVDNKIDAEETKRAQDVALFIQSLFGQAQLLGIPAKELGRLVYYESLRYRQPQPLHALIVESFRGELDFYCSELSSELGINVSGVLLQDIDTDADLKKRVQSYDFAIAPFYFLEKAEQSLKQYDLTVRGIGAGSALVSFVALSQIPQQKKIAIICTEKNGAQYMVDALCAAGIEFKNYRSTWVQATRFVEVVDWADILIASEGAMPKVKDLSSDKEIFNYAHVLDRSTLSMLQRFIADLTEQRAQKPSKVNLGHKGNA